jgi:hypothetical protein
MTNYIFIIFLLYILLSIKYIMSQFRCFNTPRELDLTQTSSDRTNNIRNKTIYSSISQHKNIKKNNFSYNSGVNLNFSTDCNCLISAPSHTDLLQVTKGAYLTNPISTEIGEEYKKCKYDIKDGNFMVTTYGPRIVDSSFGIGNYNKILQGPFCHVCPDLCNNYPGVVVDPSFTVFYNVSGGCVPTVNFMKNVEIDDHYRHGTPSQTFNQYASYDKLHGFVYPRTLNFTCPKKNNEVE